MRVQFSLAVSAGISGSCLGLSRKERTLNLSPPACANVEITQALSAIPIYTRNVTSQLSPAHSPLNDRKKEMGIEAFIAFLYARIIHIP